MQKERTSMQKERTTIEKERATIEKEKSSVGSRNGTVHEANQHIPVYPNSRHGSQGSILDIQNYNVESFEPKPLNKDTYYIDYKTKAQDVAQIMDSFVLKEGSSAKKTSLPGEYYVLKKNFDLLYDLFKVAFF